MIKCCIFDLDGVVVDTARFHFLVWAELARELGFTLSPDVAEATKGVGRMDSLNLVLAAGGMQARFTANEKEVLAERKNTRYLAYVAGMTPRDVLPGVAAFLQELRVRGVRVVLGSSSKNAMAILARCGIRPLFDAVVDGTQVAQAKPDPEVFLRGAELVGCEPAVCVVFEDAQAGIEAATRAGMRSIGVGDCALLRHATLCIESFKDFTSEQLFNQID